MSLATSAEDLTEMAESESSSSTEASPDLQMPAKTRSCEDLGKEIKEEMHSNQLTRRLSDPNLAREFPLDSLSLESTRMLPLLNQIKTSHDDGLRQMKSCKIANSASEVNKCASVETLKAHEDDEHVVDMAVKNTGPETVSLLHEKLGSKVNCCDTLNNNDSHTTEHCNSTLDIHTNKFHQAPSSFEDSSETLTGDLTEVNQHLMSAETVINCSGNECVNLLVADSEATAGECFSVNLPGNTVDCINSADSGSSAATAAAAAKVMLEKCSSTSDLNFWQMNKQQNLDSKWVMSTSVITNASDGITLQHFAAPQPKLPYGVDISKIHSSLPHPPPPLLPFPSLPEIAVGFSKDTEMGGSETPSGCSSNPVTPNGESKVINDSIIVILQIQCTLMRESFLLVPVLEN